MRVLGLLAATLVAACSSTSTPTAPSVTPVDPGNTTVSPAEVPPGGFRVLIIGNSLTYTNDLPGTLAYVSQSAGVQMTVESVAGPNLAVIDHALGMTNAVDVIRSAHWDYVILQQGPTYSSPFRDTLVLAAEKLDPYIRASGGKTALLMVWPTVDDLPYIENDEQSYRLAAYTVGGLFIPAGYAWQFALGARHTIAIYGPDNFHPTPLGTYLTAVAIYEAITRRDARSLPDVAFAAGHTLGNSADDVQLLQKSAHDAISTMSGP